MAAPRTKFQFNSMPYWQSQKTTQMPCGGDYRGGLLRRRISHALRPQRGRRIFVFGCFLYIFGVLPGSLCGSQSIQWLGSAGISWGFVFFSDSKEENAVEIENYGFLIRLYIFGVLPVLPCESQSTHWQGSAGFSWVFSFFSVAKRAHAVEI